MLTTDIRRHSLLVLTGLCLVLAVIATVLLPLRAAAAAGVPMGASGVYTGPCRTADATTFSSWRGKPNAVIVDTLDMRRYSNIADPTWWTGCWGAGAPMVYGVAMVTYDDGGSLAAGASGAYDAHFRAMAQKLVAGGQGHAWLRLGFEFNGKWFPWRAAADPTAFTNYYRRIVDVMRSVPGQSFKYVWNPTIGVEEIPAERVWPGAGYVDAIGLDVYDGSWAPGTYPVPAGASAAEIRTRQETAWQHYKTMDHGLDWWARYAAAQGKPLALPEWGLIEPSHNGGGDNPLFIERMRTWISTNNIAFESYFNAIGAWGDHRLHSGKYPLAAARYKQLFGGSAPVVTAPTPTASATPVPTAPATTPVPASPTPVPAGPAVGTVITRINAGGPGVADGGVWWNADRGYIGGTSTTFPTAVASPTPTVAKSERWGATGWDIPVPAARTYKLRITAAENWFTARGKRVFSITADGTPVVSDLDLFARVGKGRSLTLEVPVVVKDGVLNVRLSARMNHATVSGIEVIAA